MVNTPGMPIHPLLPLTSTPNGVNVAACSNAAATRNQKLHLRYRLAGSIIVTNATPNPSMQ